MDPLSALRMPGTQELQRAFSPGPAAAPGPISPAELQKLTPAQLTQPAATAEPAAFSQVLGNLVQEVSSKQAASREAVGGVLAGDNVSLHQAIIAMEEASVSFQLMVEVRNKLLESYQELMRMQI
jgi:flagellar hook-basal body complex protein FliE